MNKRILVKAIKFISILVLVGVAIVLLNRYGIEQLRSQVAQLGWWAPVALIALRAVSVIIPALPSTAYSLLAGGLFGFVQGVAIICVADVLSCVISFYLSRRYGRSLVQRLVGERFMSRVDRLSERHLERNFFLMTAFLMTGFFDFVCYGVGLTTAPWRRFLPALLLAVAISTPPVVALGAGILSGGGNLLLPLALLGVFALAVITGLVQTRRRLDPPVAAPPQTNSWAGKS